MLVQCWPTVYDVGPTSNIEPTLVQCLVFARMTHVVALHGAIYADSDDHDVMV